jgi:acylphosphatase
LAEGVSSSEDSAHWIVSGRVQGVGFRWFVLQAARDCGVRGDVRNLPDGSVEIRATGRPEQLTALLSEVRAGPRGARVDSVERREADSSLRFVGFDIRR